MPISIIVGAQYGSEGKGKVAHAWASRYGASVTVRVGGPNSGHTAVHDGQTHVFRQLPTAVLWPGIVAVLPPGSYIDASLLLREIESLGLGPDRLVVDPRAVVVTAADVDAEREAQLARRIGSTGSGTGSAVARRIRRDGSTVRAADVEELRPYLGDTLPLLHATISERGRVLIEGTQGYGLSLLHGLEGDFATSRDTTAAGFLSETGLSPRDVDQVVLVARSFPIRVAGNSGSLAFERSWEDIGAKTGRKELIERTTVTNRIRRVGDFEPEVVRRAIYANSPSHIILNHLDYVSDVQTDRGRAEAAGFVQRIEEALQSRIDYLGLDAARIVSREEFHAVI
ncbi:adenylosuccinate synthetase [Microbacterium sp. Root180]|uniref:adenylosuccinate synthetase n=1 Tax=Microbacterium sp. Root180 TaxID=1736483 RepID=UPI0009E6F5A5|nr:adenylosuccinate synthetase [Microbacterium sp. Root180]